MFEVLFEILLFYFMVKFPQWEDKRPPKRYDFNPPE